jgi:hypothetical protein
VPPGAVRAYAWIGHALFAHPPGSAALPCLHSRPSVQRVAARLSGRLEEQRRIVAQRGQSTLCELGEAWRTRSACSGTVLRARPGLIVPASGVRRRTQMEPAGPCRACTSPARSCVSSPTLAPVYAQSHGTHRRQAGGPPCAGLEMPTLSNRLCHLREIKGTVGSRLARKTSRLRVLSRSTLRPIAPSITPGTLGPPPTCLRTHRPEGPRGGGRRAAIAHKCVQHELSASGGRHLWENHDVITEPGQLLAQALVLLEAGLEAVASFRVPDVNLGPRRGVENASIIRMQLVELAQHWLAGEALQR